MRALCVATVSQWLFRPLRAGRVVVLGKGLLLETILFICLHGPFGVRLWLYSFLEMMF